MTRRRSLALGWLLLLLLPASAWGLIYWADAVHALHAHASGLEAEEADQATVKLIVDDQSGAAARLMAARKLGFSTPPLPAVWGRSTSAVGSPN